MLGLESALDRGLLVISCRDEVCKPPRPVYAFPEKRIDGHHVRLVPRNLRGHEIPHARQLHNLRKCSRITENIREPQNLAVLSELAAEESLSIENLTA